MSMPIAQLRTHFQSARIQDGVQSGELTRKEARELRADQREIRGALQEARADGQVTACERKEIRGLQNEASRDIRQAKHDGDTRGTPRADRRQEHQQERLRDGIEDGSVTRREAFMLRSMQRFVDRAESRMKADGEVTPQERARLESLQDQASQQIYRARHNGATRA